MTFFNLNIICIFRLNKKNKKKHMTEIIVLILTVTIVLGILGYGYRLDKKTS